VCLGWLLHGIFDIPAKKTISAVFVVAFLIRKFVEFVDARP